MYDATIINIITCVRCNCDDDDDCIRVLCDRHHNDDIRVQCSRHDDDHPKVTLGFLKLSILKLAIWSEYELPLISEQWLE